MAFRDLREWLAFLEETEELVHIKREVAPEPEVGALGRAICDLEAPGALVERVAGFRVPLTIGLHASWRRANLALGLPPSASRQEATARIMEAYDRYPVPARPTQAAPCQENVLTGDKVNLFQFPIPRINQHDASFYITKGLVITRDPDTGWVNVGIYRLMVLGPDRTGIIIEPFQHIGHHFRKYLARGEDMPVAVALGTDPVLPMVAGGKVPAGWNEYDFAGALRGEPVEVVTARTVPLPVPARAEIVLEGFVKKDERILEGPFGEFPGAYSGYQITPVFEIRAITHRDNPIYDHLYLGRPYSEADYLSTGTKLAGLWRDIKPRFPDVTEVALLPSYWHLCVVQGRWKHTGDPRQVMFALWAHGQASKYIIAVDEDVDPWNAQEVLWAVSIRSQGDKDFVMVPDSFAMLDPSQSLHGTTCKMGIDATRSRPPYHRSEPVAWLEPPEGTEQWKKELRDLMSRKGRP